MSKTNYLFNLKFKFNWPCRIFMFLIREPEVGLGHLGQPPQQVRLLGGWLTSQFGRSRTGTGLFSRLKERDADSKGLRAAPRRDRGKVTFGRKESSWPGLIPARLHLRSPSASTSARGPRRLRNLSAAPGSPRRPTAWGRGGRVRRRDGPVGGARARAGKDDARPGVGAWRGRRPFARCAPASLLQSARNGGHGHGRLRGDAGRGEKQKRTL